jgi:hypothetical protein
MRIMCLIEQYWGLVMTHHLYRGQGYGSAMCGHIDSRTQDRVNRTGVPVMRNDQLPEQRQNESNMFA